jgi:hypothetical protein
MNHPTNHHASLKHDDIARRAYLLWEREGKPADRDQEHWFRAQEQLSRTEKQVESVAGAAGNNAAEAASATPSRSVVPTPASPVVRNWIATAALPAVDTQLEPGRRSLRRKRRATA